MTTKTFEPTVCSYFDEVSHVCRLDGTAVCVFPTRRYCLSKLEHIREEERKSTAQICEDDTEQDYREYNKDL